MSPTTAGQAVMEIRRRLGVAVFHSPLRKIVGEVSGPDGLHEVLACGHVRRGRYDRTTGFSTAARRHCLACFRGEPPPQLGAYVLGLSDVGGPVQYPHDDRWDIVWTVGHD
jgi:hypothetical protein